MPSDYPRILADNLREYGEGKRHLAILGRLYTDRTHFVFELLQNAEDAGATSVRFELRRDRLDVWHDGRPFEERDVRGVCGVGETTKAEDLTKIGKFGVGFKSVYAYTATPEIRSGDEHFRIEDFVRPFEAPPLALAGNWTTLQRFPFDHAEIEPRDAFAEIARRLEHLGARTLLFLRSVGEIQWHIEGGAKGIYLRETQGEQALRRVMVLGQQDGRADVDEEWLVFERPVPYPTEDEVARVEVAFLLGRDRESECPTIVPVRGSHLVVFFPTEKETHLGFLLQGPFRTTPARDNIPVGDPWNHRLVNEAATLVIDALHELKGRGLMSVSLLQTLPIRHESFAYGTMFRPIFDRVRSALRDTPLLPTHDGGFVAARDAKIARRGEASLLDLFSAQRLAALFGRSGVLHWLNTEISEASTPELYRYLVGQRASYGSSGIDALVEDLEVRPETIVPRLTASFLDKQDDAWLGSLYALLGERRAVWHSLRSRPILRLEDGRHVTPFREDETPSAYLPPDGDTTLPIVRRAVVANEAARQFLVELGLGEPDMVAEILEQVVPKYRPGSAAGQREPVGDFRRIIRAFEAATPEKRALLIDVLRELPFLAAYNPEIEDSVLEVPQHIYLGDEHLWRYFRGNEDCLFLDDACYGQELLKEVGIRSFLAQLGVASQVRVWHAAADCSGHVTIRSQHGDHARGLAGFDPDFEIDGLAHALGRRCPDLAAYIWNTLLVPHAARLRGEVESSKRQTYANSSRAEQLSVAGQLVSQEPWLPDRGGAFRHRSDLSLDDLPDNFARSEALAAALDMRTSQARALAAEVGIEPDDLLLLRAHPGELRRLLVSLRAKDEDGENADSVAPLISDPSADQGLFDGDDDEDDSPESVDTDFDYRAGFEDAFAHGGSAGDLPLPIAAGQVANPVLRRERIAAAIAEARASELRPEQRFSRVPTKVWERKDNSVRAFLANQYLGECQICHGTFRRRDGAPYFEGLYIVPRSRAQWIDRPGNVLCLCATCCAKFQHGTVEASDVVRQIEAFRAAKEGGQTEPAIHLLVCGEPRTIRFTEAHLLDLQESLRASDVAVAQAV